MKSEKHQFVIDDSGEKTAVILGIDEYNQLLEELEELESLRVYDHAKASNDETIPFEQAVIEIERKMK